MEVDNISDSLVWIMILIVVVSLYFTTKEYREAKIFTRGWNAHRRMMQIELAEGIDHNKIEELLDLDGFREEELFKEKINGGD